MRRPFLDNARNAIVLSVVVYHVIYLFNSVGVIRNVTLQGIPALDTVLYLLSPWFMCALFAISGIASRYALEKRTRRALLKERAVRILAPCVCGVFLLGWLTGYVTSLYTDFFAGNGGQVPGIVKYLVFCFAGIGPLWFGHQLFLVSAALVLVLKLDKHDRLSALGERVSLPALLGLAALVWACAQVGNAPVVEVYRNGLYLCLFFLGYFVLSHDRVLALLGRYAPLFLGLAAAGELAFTLAYFGENYAALEAVQSPLCCFCAWFGTLAILGSFYRWGNRETSATRWLSRRCFGIYALHYPALMCGVLLLRLTPAPVWSYYPLLLGWVIVAVPPAYEVLSRTPALRLLLLGERKMPVKGKSA